LIVLKPTSRAMELALTGRSLSAPEALEWGLVNRVVPDGELAGAASDLAAGLASGPTEAFGASKRLLHGGFNETLETQMEQETRTMSQVARSDDAREGLQAFFEKRPARFHGR
jgi:2-(1,2-epoxy-1,2-dihydrophenyl)acetyl-CoA isomerase